MNYIVKAVKIFMKGMNTEIEDYQRVVPNYLEAEKEVARLKSLGDYSSISIKKINHNK